MHISSENGMQGEGPNLMKIVIILPNFTLMKRKPLRIYHRLLVTFQYCIKEVP